MKTLSFYVKVFICSLLLGTVYVTSLSEPALIRSVPQIIFGLMIVSISILPKYTRYILHAGFVLVLIDTLKTIITQSNLLHMTVSDSVWGTSVVLVGMYVLLYISAIILFNHIKKHKVSTKN